VSDFEAAVERLEVEILSEKGNHGLDELRNLRRSASRLRRMLLRTDRIRRPRATRFPAAQLGRGQRPLPAPRHPLRAGDDVVQNTRDLVVGSFELFSSQTALRTNEAMRALTFVTVLIGTLAVVAASSA